MPQRKPELIDTAEVARRLRITPARVSQLVQAGELTPTLRGKPMWFDAAAVERYKRARIADLLKQAQQLRST